MKTALILVVTLATGCGGKVLYAGRLTREQVEPAADLWREIGATVDIVYDTVPPAGADVVVMDRWLEGPDGTRRCGTEGGVLETDSIHISERCVGHTISIHDDLAHEIGHWLGLHHIPVEGIMAPSGYLYNPDGSFNMNDNPLSCTDVRNYCTFNPDCNYGDHCK